MDADSHKSVLLIADPYLPVPPVHYGGVERIIGMLAEGLQARDWSVRMICHPGSTCPVEIIPLHLRKGDALSRLRNAAKVAQCVITGGYDIVHSFGHFDLTAGFWPTARRQIQSFQAPPHPESLAKRIKFLQLRNVWFTTCGHHMVKDYRHLAPTVGIHNGVKIGNFTFRESVEADAPLVFLGRIEPIKGTHIAIQIAKATNRRLVIAGNRSASPEIDRYFTDEIESQLSEQITYIGPVDDIQKNQLLGEAAALLMPIEWDEPFGIVMAEALACGTPVIGFARGALPEIVNHGITGACCHSVEEMVEAVQQVADFSRLACRHEAEKRFSAPVIVDQYIELYGRVLAGNKVGSSSLQPQA